MLHILLCIKIEYAAQLDCIKVIDHVNSFSKLYELLPEIILQWIGRTRSSGLKGVGYLSFLLRTKPNLKLVKPDAFFYNHL